MGLHVMHICIVAVLCVSLSIAASVSGNVVVMVKSPVSVHRSHTTILPCWLNPPQDAEGLEVRWYRGDGFDTPILNQKQKVSGSKEASYEGRVSFGLKDATSGGMKAGDVSLKLVNVTIKDAGDYTCYVSSDQGYDRATVSLSVIETGTSPFLSVLWKEGNLVNVSCESAGWYPQPQLRWSDQKQDLKPDSLEYSKDSSGLVSAHSWVLLSRSSEVSCSVVPYQGEAKEARVYLKNPSKQESGCSMAGWVAFAVLLIIMLAFLALLYFKKRDLFLWKKDESRGDQVDGNHLSQPLLNKADVNESLAEAKNYYVNVTLDKEDHPYLTIKDCKLRDRNNVVFPDGENVTCTTAIRGTSGFSSGKHYWEVSLGNEGLGLKQSWWLGVTSATVIPEERNILAATSNGFWFLSSDREDCFQFSTEPKVSLPVLSRPQTIGVYLNYDSGQLSFYNVEAKHVIGSLKATFTGEVFPFFNPGKGDKAPMEILHKIVNTEDSKAQEAES